jgi:hypothetical protein
VVGETTMIREPIRYVVYLRARNGRQGRGGLGMDVQYAAVVEFLRQRGGTIVAQYVEGETGNRSDRPELARALESARKDNATLLIAKLGRLARNAAFIANLMDAGVEFRAVHRQNIWRRAGRRLAECWPRLGVDVRRRVCGAASADVRWSSV